MARKARKSKGNTSKDIHEILGGKAQIFRVAQSGDVWQFKMWITAEQKYLRKSLRTKDSRGSGIMSEEEWALVQGMTYSELRRDSNVGSFLDDAEKKFKDK